MRVLSSETEDAEMLCRSNRFITQLVSRVILCGVPLPGEDSGRLFRSSKNRRPEKVIAGPMIDAPLVDCAKRPEICPAFSSSQIIWKDTGLLRSAMWGSLFRDASS